MDDTRGNLGSSGTRSSDDTTRRLVPGPARRAPASRGARAHRSELGSVDRENARRFHQRPAFAFVVDVWGTILTAATVALALLGGCATTGKPCSAWNAGRAAACAVCALPECGSEVGGGEVLVDPAELAEACER